MSRALATVLVPAIGLLVTSCAHTSSQRFSLVDVQTGKTAGPYHFRDGATITVDGRQLRIEKLADADALLRARLNDVIVPVVDFRDAEVEDVIAWLRVPTVVSGEDDALQVDPMSAAVVLLDPAKPPRKITLQARFISVWCLLEVVAEQADLTLSIEGGHLYVRQKG